MRSALILSLVASAVFASTASAVLPSGLTTNGRIVWNFEALAHAYYGTANLCSPSALSGIDYTRAACTKLDSADRMIYEPVFSNARGSSFTLTGRAPSSESNLAPIKMGGSYIACSPSLWLEMTQVGEWVCATRIGEIDPLGS